MYRRLNFLRMGPFQGIDKADMGLSFFVKRWVVKHKFLLVFPGVLLGLVSSVRLVGGISNYLSWYPANPVVPSYGRNQVFFLSRYDEI